MHKVLLDTDIGTDVDDILALTLILGSPELELLGVTSAYGDTPLRAGLIREVLRLTSREDVPVATGCSSTFNGERKPWMAGHEGRNANLPPSPNPLQENGEEAVDLILNAIQRNPHEVTLFAIGPLTNIALACERAPDVMRRLKAIYVMGGAFAFNDPSLAQPRVEHNIRCDPEAARVVFETGLPITLFPLDVTLRTPLMPDDIDLIGDSGHPLRRFLRAELGTWLEFIGEKFKRKFTYLHDPLTIAALVDPSIILRTVQTGIVVECEGGLTSGMTLPFSGHLQKSDNVVAPEIDVVADVDAPRFYQLFLERIVNFGTSENAVGEIPLPN